MRRRQQTIAAAAAWLAVLAASPPAAHALPAGVRLDAYHHDVWTGKEGAPREIMAMAQTADGWLWLGTTTGLYRFDGVRFEAFAAPAGEHLLGTHITALTPAPDGGLWIGYTSGGASVLRGGHLHHAATGDGKPVGVVYAMALEADGSLWVASGARGLLHYRDGAWTRAGAAMGYPERAEYVYRDHDDRLWAADGGQVYLLDRATQRFAAVRKTVQNPLLLTSPDGRVWVSDNTAVQLLPAPAGGWRPRPASSIHASSYQSLFDRDGNFWVGNCPTGLCRRYPSSWQAQADAFADSQGDERLDQPWQMSGLQVDSAMEDREGNLWIGTVNGLDRFRPNKLVRVAFPPAELHLSLATDAAGTVWAATEQLNKRGHLWRIRDGAPMPWAADQDVHIVAPGNDGTVLVGGTRRIERRRGDALVASYPLPAPEPGKPTDNNVVHAADDGPDLWIGISGRGLYCWHDGAWRPPAAHPQLAGTIFMAPGGGGRMWFGLRDNRLVLHDGAGWHAYGERDGIAVGHVRFIAAGAPVVIGGDNGLAVLQGGRFRMLAAADGIDLSGVSGMAATPDGDRWLNTSRGLLHVGGADWHRSLRDPALPLQGVLWDTLDGYPGSSERTSHVRSAFVAADGKVWVAGTNGAAWFDPAAVQRNRLPPPVRILGVAAGGRRHPADAPLAFAPGTTNLQIDYTALSFTMPERVRFRYRLAGADADWQDVGTRRVAYYTNLGPGTYRFEVAAVNEDGVASPVARTAPIGIAPRFVQTGWFDALCALLALLAVYLLYLLRVGQVTRQLQARMEERLGERARIARTLHDTFLQSLQGLILHLDALATRVAPGGEVHAQLARVGRLAGQVLDEGRDRVLDLRVADTARPLEQALADAALALRPGDGADVQVRAHGPARPLAPAVYDEVLFIAREAIANALRHAHARTVDVTLDWRAGGLDVAVRDDGDGLSGAVLAHGRAGHWGLTGMRERAERIGATLAVRNRGEGGRGAEVVLHVPRRRLAGQRPRRWPWRRQPA